MCQEMIISNRMQKVLFSVNQIRKISTEYEEEFQRTRSYGPKEQPLEAPQEGHPKPPQRESKLILVICSFIIMCCLQLKNG